MLGEAELQILRGLAAGKTQAEIGTDLNLGQSAISKMLRAAESRCGFELVARNGRRLGLTQLGEEVARASGSLLAEFAALDHLLAALRIGVSGPVRILASSEPADYVLPDVIAAFLEHSPQTQIQLQVAPGDGTSLTPNHLLELCTSGRFDIALLPKSVPAPAPLIVEPLYDDEAVFFVGRDHHFGAGEERSPSQLADEPLVGNFLDPWYANIWQHVAQTWTPEGRRIDVRTTEAVKRLVSEGVGVGILARSTLRDELRSGQLRVVATGPEALYRQTFVLIHHPAALSAPPALKLRRFLMDQLH